MLVDAVNLGSSGICKFLLACIVHRVVGRMQIASTIVYEDVQHEMFNYIKNLYEFNGDVYHT